MSTWRDPSDIFLVTNGIKVHRDAALPVDDGALFTISGGNVLLLGFLGHVTVAIKNESLDIGLVLDPADGGSNVDIAESTTGLAIDADVAGTFYTLNPTAAAVMVATLDVAYNAALATPIVLAPGDLELTIVGSVTGTADRIEWDLWYVPITEGAVVEAA